MSIDNYLIALRACEKHAGRLQWAIESMKPRFPMNAETLSSLTETDQAIMDQLILRYSKLQDAMGARLFPALLDVLQEPGDLDTFVDKLNRLEKLGVIESAEQWQEFREMRNQFAHDYPDDPELQASLLNKGFTLAEGLLASLQHTSSFANRFVTKS